MADSERIRIVTFGASQTGKSAILKRFLFNSFADKHKPTVQDLYSNEFQIGQGVKIKTDILDTSGELQFPAMRRLSITTAQAFLLVYAVDDLESFNTVKTLLDEIRQQREDFDDIPIIVAGNKVELPAIKKDVEFDVVCDFLHENFPKIRGKAMECSAKEGRNVREIFKTFLQLSKLYSPVIPLEEASHGGFGSQLRRRSSAYAGSKGGHASIHTSTTPTSSACGSPRSTGFGLMRGGASNTPFDLEEGGNFGRNKPRSRSLIRRSSSKKTKPQMRDGSSGGAPTDCIVT